jgi:hypothetical protein
MKKNTLLLVPALLLLAAAAHNTRCMEYHSYLTAEQEQLPPSERPIRWSVIFHNSPAPANHPSIVEQVFFPRARREPTRLDNSIEELLRDPNSPNFASRLDELFTRAIYYGNAEQVQLLMNAKADPCAPSHGEQNPSRFSQKTRPLWKAVDARKIPTARLLLAAKADIEALEENGDRVLHQSVRNATRQNKHDLVKFLLGAGARPTSLNKYGKTAQQLVLLQRQECERDLRGYQRKCIEVPGWPYWEDQVVRTERYLRDLGSFATILKEAETRYLAHYVAQYDQSQQSALNIAQLEHAQEEEEKSDADLPALEEIGDNGEVHA